jgi:hypothetical protein
MLHAVVNLLLCVIQGPETIQLLPGGNGYAAHIAVPFEVSDHVNAGDGGSGSFSIYGVKC